MEGSNGDVGTLDYIFYIVGAVVAAVLAYLGKNKKDDPPPPTVATVSGALMDNRVVDPLRVEIQMLTTVMREFAALCSAEAELRAEETKKREIRADIEAERRMHEMLERMEGLLEQKRGPRTPPKS